MSRPVRLLLALAPLVVLVGLLGLLVVRRVIGEIHGRLVAYTNEINLVVPILIRSINDLVRIGRQGRLHILGLVICQAR